MYAGFIRNWTFVQKSTQGESIVNNKVMYIVNDFFNDLTADEIDLSYFFCKLQGDIYGCDYLPDRTRVEIAKVKKIKRSPLINMAVVVTEYTNFLLL